MELLDFLLALWQDIARSTLETSSSHTHTQPISFFLFPFFVSKNQPYPEFNTFGTNSVWNRHSLTEMSPQTHFTALPRSLNNGKSIDVHVYEQGSRWRNVHNYLLRGKSPVSVSTKELWSCYSHLANANDTALPSFSIAAHWNRNPFAAVTSVDFEENRWLD